MANTTIALRSSGTAAATPSLGVLANGELSINYADGIIYYKTASNTLGSIRTTQPAGLTTEVQFNDAGSFGSNAALTFNKTTSQLNVTNLLVNTTLTTGAGAGGTIAGANIIYANNFIANTGGITTAGNSSLNGIVTVNYNVGAASSQNAAIEIYGANTKGGTGYFDFISANNRSAGTTNRNKYFRIDANGNFQIINSNYTTNLFDLNDAGYLIIPGGLATSQYIQFSDGSRQYTANASLSNNQILAGLQTVSPTANITFDTMILANNNNGRNLRIGDDAWIGDVNLADTLAIRGAFNTANAYIVFGSADTTALGRAGSGPLTYGGNTVWHAGNDGASSGLDADTVDGLHASSFANATFANTDYTTISATAAVYGNASHVPVTTLTANGRVSSITNTAIALDAAAITTGTLAVARGGTGATTAPAAMANLMGYTSTATATGTTTLTNTSSYYQQFTGSTTQTVVLPVTSTLTTGWTFHIVNNSSGLVTVQSSGLNTVIIVPAGTTAMVTCIATATTTAADWESGITDFSTYTGTGAVVLNTAPILSSIELGNASDTTLSRSSAGVLAVEGVVVPTISSTSTLTNKTLTLPVIDNIKLGYSTTVTAAGTTTLTSSSNRQQFFTGTNTQILSLPAPQTMTLGMGFFVVNNSTGSIEVRASNAAVVAIIPGGTAALFVSIDLTAGNGAAGWSAEFVGFSSAVLPFGNGGSNNTTYTTGAILTSNGTAFVALANTGTAGTYANSTYLPVITTDAYGRVSAVTNTAISFPVTSVAGSTGAISNNQILAGLLTVDGVGSGLDADLLDGFSYTAFANAAFANTRFASSGGSITGDVTVTGNLTIVGQTVYANTTSALIADNILTLNAAIGQASAPAANAGIEVDRGSSANTYLLWNEVTDKWQYTNDGTTYYDMADAGRLDSVYALANGTAGIANTDYTTISTSAGVYGNASYLPVVTLAANGRVSSITNTAIAISAAAITSGTLAVARGGTGVTTSTGTGAVVLNTAPTLSTPTVDRVDWPSVGYAPPSFTTRSTGTKLNIYPALSGSSVDYAIGIDGATLWSSVPQATNAYYFKWYAGESNIASLDGTGRLTVVTANIVSTNTSTSNTTGALTVMGGVGVKGNVSADAINFPDGTRQTTAASGGASIGDVLALAIALG